MGEGVTWFSVSVDVFDHISHQIQIWGGLLFSLLPQNTKDCKDYDETEFFKKYKIQSQPHRFLEYELCGSIVIRDQIHNLHTNTGSKINTCHQQIPDRLDR